GLTRFDSQTLTQLSLIDESLTHHGGPRNLALLETAAGIHAALMMPSHYLQIPQMCHEQTHSAWRDTCQSLGQMMHKQMRDPFEMMMGLKLLGEMDLHL